jgi:hypothetical protein
MLPHLTCQTLDDIEAEIGELGGANDGDESVDANHAEATMVASPVPRSAEAMAEAEAEPSAAEAALQDNKENDMVRGKSGGRRGLAHDVHGLPGVAPMQRCGHAQVSTRSTAATHAHLCSHSQHAAWR